jgi:predicted O-linked N-acetylglucosamine transferase (SPINDLY family)
MELGRLDEAQLSYETALVANPEHALGFSGVANCVIKLCQLDKWNALAGELSQKVTDQTSVVTPFVLLRYSGEPELQWQCARSYAAYKVPSLPEPIWTGERWRHDKLRVAYLSADFREHAMSYLIAGMLERHDRSRFEITGVSFGPDDGGATRRRLAAAFDQFLDVRADSDAGIARHLRDLEVDIAVDLMGYTRHSRPAILSHRPAPIQVSYLGYPGTMGVEWIDYVIADAVVAPFSQQPFFTESIVQLPDCY